MKVWEKLIVGDEADELDEKKKMTMQRGGMSLDSFELAMKESIYDMKDKAAKLLRRFARGEFSILEELANVRIDIQKREQLLVETQAIRSALEADV